MRSNGIYNGVRCPETCLRVLVHKKKIGAKVYGRVTLTRKCRKWDKCGLPLSSRTLCTDARGFDFDIKRRSHMQLRIGMIFADLNRKFRCGFGDS